MKEMQFVWVFLLLFVIKASAQLSVPYYNDFTKMSDTTGWSHYSLSGSDDWEYGLPLGNTLDESFSPPYVWATNLDGDFTTQSVMCLETPSFDLSNTAVSYRLSFAHQMEGNSGDGGNVEYSTDNGQSWHLLNGHANDKVEWYNNASCSGLYGEPAWSNNYYTFGFRFSFHKLDSLAGQSNVKFRFKFGGSAYFPPEGWVIDHFRIEENAPNVYPVLIQPDNISKSCPSIDLTTKLVYSSYNTFSYSNKTNYYWSTDSIFDSADSLILSVTQNVNSNTTFTETIMLPMNLSQYKYYLFVHVDADSNLTENDEIDNLSRTELIVDSISPVPIAYHFDSSTSAWTKGGKHSWELKSGYVHRFEGAHSGSKAWVIYDTDEYNVNFIESPHIDASLEDSTLISFWYRSRYDIQNLPYYTPIRFFDGCNSNMDNIADIPKPRGDSWDFYNAWLPEKADTSEDIRVRIYNGNGYYDHNGYELVIDDIYIGKVRPDLTLEGNKMNRFTISSKTIDTLNYTIVNSGLEPSSQTITAFYWSSDSILSSNDVLLGVQSEQVIPDTSRLQNQFIYSKPTTATGKYYIIYSLDSSGVCDEMREYNNTGFFTIYQDSLFSLPYYNDFENQVYGWRHNSSLKHDNWQWTTPKGVVLDSTFSGSKAWVSNDTGIVCPMSRMHLYTPIFDFQNISNPVMEFDMKLDNGKGTKNHLNLNMSYSTDGGETWVVLDTTSQSFNRWYYPSKYTYSTAGSSFINTPNISRIMFKESERAFVGYEQRNGRNTRRNTRYNLDIGFLSGHEMVQFRFNLATGENKLNEGALIDNFSITEARIDLNVDYKQALMISSKRSEVNFYMHILNQGNYMSVPCTTKYYLSKDTLLDPNDKVLGEVSMPEVRPDLFHYTNHSFSPVDSIFYYDYLIYELDKSDENQEDNELNNTGYWPLSLDSVNTYPYYNDFSGEVVNGWYQFAFDPYYNSIENKRIRNYLAPQESNQYNLKEPGQWFTEHVATSFIIYTPWFYLESPAFSFDKLDSLFLSFDLLCTGEKSFNSCGGNMEFSTDGGNNWHVLKDSLGHSHNWYLSYFTLDLLNNEPGWAENPNPNQLLDSTAYDISFLKGEKHVVFRFKYRSNQGQGQLQGMRMDDFLIQGFNVDYIAENDMSPVSAKIANPEIAIDYSISNAGQSNGRLTTTLFFWSEDSLFDASDALLETVTEPRISSGTTLNKTVDITYPSLVSQKEYYVFYVSDADSNLLELNEANNLGSFKIEFDSTNISIQNIEAQGIDLYANNRKLYIISSYSDNPSDYRLDLLQLDGKIVFQKNIMLNKGENIISLSSYITDGIYFVRLRNNKAQITRKILIRK